MVFPASSGTVAAPQSEELQPTTATEIEPRQSDRQGRAMYYTKITTITTPAPSNVTDNQTEKIEHIDNIDHTPEVNATANVTDIVHPSLIWTAINATDVLNVTNTNDTVATNVTDAQNTTFATKKRNLTRPVFGNDETVDGIPESRIVTEKPLSLETTFLQTRIPPNIESSRRVIDQDDGGMDTGAIAGISFAALVLAALAGSTAFVMYRRRYLNKPQTLNDKCSNPDSSGYLDDSTIRVCITSCAPRFRPRCPGLKVAYMSIQGIS